MTVFAVILTVFYGIGVLTNWWLAANPGEYGKNAWPGHITFAAILRTFLALFVVILLLPESPAWFGAVLLADLCLQVAIRFARMLGLWMKEPPPAYFTANALVCVLLAVGVGYFYLYE